MKVSLTASIGVAIFPVHGDAGRLTNHADAAMVAGKRQGGNMVRAYEAGLLDGERAESDLLDALRDAPSRGELSVEYQPKIHAASGQVTGLEALVRWNRPGHGWISPGVFIPIAERHALIDGIGTWVLKAVCRQLGEWRRSGLHMRVAINLSAHQLKEQTLAAEIARELARHGVDPSRLTCEITETVAMADSDTVLACIRSLSDAGVRISIDDFGTGYSSLSYLSRLSVHQLKIDRSFVAELSESAEARLVVEAIIRLAHSLRLEVVAEGVETENQRRVLVGLGCDELQGFLFARPMTAHQFASWVTSDRSGDLMRPSIYADVSDLCVGGLAASHLWTI